MAESAMAALFARSTPSYVRASPIAWEIVDSATGEARSEHAGLKAALDAAAASIPDKRDAQGAPVRVMRGPEGEPDGAWRFLPAASAEDVPNEQDGVRLTERSIWQFADRLNQRPQPIGIDGGPGSVVHGLATDSSTPINGAAHRGIVVYDYEGRAGLYLHAELVPNVAQLIDRGQLAWGSCHFWTSEPLDETGAPEDAGLISYGLTNLPADSRITPASGVRTVAHGAAIKKTRTAMRTRSLSMTTKKNARGPAMDLLTAIAPKLGLTLAETLDEKDYCDGLSSRLWKVIDAAKLEQILEGTPMPPAEAPPGQTMQAVPPGGAPAETPRSQRSGDITEEDVPAKIKKLIGEGKDPKQAAAIAYSMARDVLELRAIAGLEDPAALESFASGALDVFRAILGKPDADPAALLTEMQASQEKLAAALSSAPPPPSSGTPADASAQHQAQPPVAPPPARELEAELVLAREAFGRPKADVLELLAHARSTIQRADHERWLNAAIADRKLAIDDKDRAELLDDVCAHGRPVIERTLNKIARPPSGQVMRSAITSTGAEPESYTEAVNDCMDQARKELGEGAVLHVVRARAQKIAAKRWPSLAERAPDAS